MVPSTGLLVGLRHREVVPGRPAFPGFDLLSFGVASSEAIAALVERFDALGVEHGPLFDRGPGGGVQLDVPDPDGTVIRFLSPFGDHPPFVGPRVPSGRPAHVLRQSSSVGRLRWRAARLEQQEARLLGGGTGL